jgi:hypothetical protein
MALVNIKEINKKINRFDLNLLIFYYIYYLYIFILHTSYLFILTVKFRVYFAFPNSFGKRYGGFGMIKLTLIYQFFKIKSKI